MFSWGSTIYSSRLSHQGNVLLPSRKNVPALILLGEDNACELGSQDWMTLLPALSCLAGQWQWHTIAGQLVKIESAFQGPTVLCALIAWADPNILNTHGSEGLREGFSCKGRLVPDSCKQINFFKVRWNFLSLVSKGLSYSVFDSFYLSFTLLEATSGLITCLSRGVWGPRKGAEEIIQSSL